MNRPIWFRWLVWLGLAVGVLILLTAFVYFFGWYLPPFILQNPALNTDAKLKAVGDVRSAFLGLLVPIAALVAGVVAFLNYRDTVAVARRGQITDRFTKAIDQLGKMDDSDLHFRLGGIYALEQIGLDSAELHWPVMEVLTAFLRENAIGTHALSSSGLETAGGEEQATSRAGEQRRRIQVRADLQAIATVLGRRPDLRRRQEGGRRIDLQRVKLQGIDPTLAELGRVNLVGADLQFARLYKVEMEFAWATGVQLQGAQLFGANLRNANLEGAQLQGATLMSANLERAILIAADLRAADIRSADLRSAFLWQANLRKASLGAADLSKAKLRDADLSGASLRGAQLISAELRNANLERTQLQNANLRGADLSTVQGLTREQLRDALLDERTQLPPNLISGPGTRF